MRTVGETDDGRKVLCEVTGGDPGYTETSKMLCESAILMAARREELPGVTVFGGGGFLTPAEAFGGLLRERLVEQGIEFQVGEVGVRQRAKGE